MACSHCGRDGHNVQTCPHVRRCSCCNGRGHDRRNCPELRVQTRAGAVVGPCSLERLALLCRGREPLLAHLYWPSRREYFEENLAKHRNGEGWLLVATPGHGVHGPSRPTINFFSADRTFVDAYEEAAASRNLQHGVLIKRAAVENIGALDGFAFADVQVGYPHGYGETDPAEFWRFDIGQHRFTSVAGLRFATVVRLATPEHWRLRRVRIAQDAIVAWW